MEGWVLGLGLGGEVRVDGIEIADDVNVVGRR